MGAQNHLVQLARYCHKLPPAHCSTISNSPHRLWSARAAVGGDMQFRSLHVHPGDASRDHSKHMSKENRPTHSWDPLRCSHPADTADPLLEGSCNWPFPPSLQQHTPSCPRHLNRGNRKAPSTVSGPIWGASEISARKAHRAQTGLCGGPTMSLCSFHPSPGRRKRCCCHSTATTPTRANHAKQGKKSRRGGEEGE